MFSRSLIITLRRIANEKKTASILPLGAVVSASRLPDYHGLPRPKRLLTWWRTNGWLSPSCMIFPTLPVKFGTVLADESRVMQLLAQENPCFILLWINMAIGANGSGGVVNIQHVFQQNCAG